MAHGYGPSDGGRARQIVPVGAIVALAVALSGCGAAAELAVGETFVHEQVEVTVAEYWSDDRIPAETSDGEKGWFVGKNCRFRFAAVDIECDEDCELELEPRLYFEGGRSDTPRHEPGSRGGFPDKPLYSSEPPDNSEALQYVSYDQWDVRLAAGDQMSFVWHFACSGLSAERLRISMKTQNSPQVSADYVFSNPGP